MNSGIKSTVAFIVVAMLAGCTSLPEPIATPGVERISFKPQPPPFCGRCETTTLVATADGQLFIEVGYWGGNYRNWKRQRTARNITLAQFSDFKRRLEPYRPAKDLLRGGETCANYVPDQQGLIVEWSHGEERLVRVFDFGCPDDRVMNEAVQAAPVALGL